MAIDYTTLFTQLGKAFNLGDTIIAAAGTDVPADIDAMLTEIRTLADPIEEQAIEDGTRSARDGFQSAAQSAVSALVQNVAQRLIVYAVAQDRAQPNTSIAAALHYLIEEMREDGESLDASTPAVTVSYGDPSDSSSSTGDRGRGENAGDGVLVFSTKRPDGLVNEHTLAELILAEITAAAAGGSATWRLRGQPAKSQLAVDWPGGSGVDRTLTSYVASSTANLVTNGDLEDESETVDYLPDGWTATPATLGTTLKLTDVEVQTVTVNGTPTGGYYTLLFTDRDGKSYATAPLAYNATATQVQIALQALPWLASVTVSSSGTSPNLTHTVTFTDVPNPAQLTSVSNLTGGTPTITHATTAAGSAYVARGARCLEFDSDGAELTAVYVPVTLAAQTQYAACLWALADVVPAAGEMVVELVDGIDGDAIEDDQGEENSFTVDCTGLSGVHQAQTGVFRTPRAMPQQVYLRIRISTEVSAGTSVFIDEVSLVPMTELYAGGPWAAAFSGPLDFVAGDEAEVTVTNDRAGAMHEWLDRTMGLRTGRRLFPTDSAGGETVDDGLIA